LLVIGSNYKNCTRTENTTGPDCDKARLSEGVVVLEPDHDPLVAHSDDALADGYEDFAQAEVNATLSHWLLPNFGRRVLILAGWQH